MDETHPADSSPDTDLFAEPPRWPKVVGITSIVWASIGLACGVCGIGSLAFMPQLMKMAEQSMGEPYPAALNPPRSLLVLAAVGTLWTFLLLAAGIATVTRRPAGRPLHLLYSIGSVLLAFVNTAFSLQYQNAVAQWAAQNPGSKWAQTQGGVGNMIGIAFGLLLGLAWPAFCIVWFGFIKRKPEDMTGGVQEPAA
jgi:hypothetical protein